MKSLNLKPAEVQRNWYIVDATNMPLGRLSSQVAAILRGKNKTTYAPSLDGGDHIIVINSDKIVLTGKKVEQKFYRYHTGYVGGLKEVGYDTLLKTKSDFAIRTCVKGMLPKNRLGSKMIKRLHIYKDASFEQTAQKPVEIKLVGKR